MHEIENVMGKNDLEAIEVMDNIKTAKVPVAVFGFRSFRQSVHAYSMLFQKYNITIEPSSRPCLKRAHVKRTILHN